MTLWTPDSWRALPALQQPHYNDQAQLLTIEEQLRQQPPLVFADEVSQLRRQLADAAQGKAFLLQGGDCAETFADFSSAGIRDLFKVLMQMAVVLTYAGRKPVIKVGRLAGQFAKPRSADTEVREGIELPSFRGDSVNGVEFTAAARAADPERMLQAYHQSTATLNLVRAFAQGGLADLHQVNDWILSFVRGNPGCDQYLQLAHQIKDALAFMEVCGITSETSSALRSTTLFTSHEALLLNYEQALTRQDSTSGQWFDCSAHMLWVGERTRQLDGAHIEFLRGIANPVGVKISNAIAADDLLRLVDILNPENEAGRLTLISRMGADKTEQFLPALAKRIADEGRQVVWSCDPMHGNTVKAANGYKTRSFDHIMLEIEQFFAVLSACGQHAGGLHLEMTGAHVTECVGGAYHVSEEDLASCYQTQCDPRLNAQQVLELSFKVAELIKS
ncbi:class II 3-deoxy-7-phosphoheptulonate synthase [Oceanicoccus sagamiensis]|uniref:Phospho-2-dehydro-3-deoxyheptonate aldolase n=1 Tax=Oceanicoccus sagamiensis TaxID=716816 RepID=A0A1X9NDW6_9GAMM|nr:3-deoxy-7-phosphoheptulonate synthase class II [Oceanicoccus sagamiensis]ARN75254.1 3-deoxy-7-phosphoheptulonate synthase [Oceanicoccus sagamiensis]